MKNTYNEAEMRAYRNARVYIQTAFVDAAIISEDPKIIEFVQNVLKVHGDINTEVK